MPLRLANWSWESVLTSFLDPGVVKPAHGKARVFRADRPNRRCKAIRLDDSALVAAMVAELSAYDIRVAHNSARIGRASWLTNGSAVCRGVTFSDCMMNELGHVCELVRYPVKSMAGTVTESAFLGWHGLDGDRRFAFRRLGDDSGFPWLTASCVAELLLYHPFGLDESTGEPLPTHVRTPAGTHVELRSVELQSEVAERFGSSVELMKLKHGIFDDASVSVISLATIAGIGREAGVDLDRRRFRANIVLETRDREPFLEDGWVGGTLVFGNSEPRPAVSVTVRDVRCMMINLDPDTGTQDARVLKTVVGLNKNNAGVYGTVVRTGTIRVGQPVSLVLDARH